MALSYESILKERQAHRSFVGKVDVLNGDGSWEESMKKPFHVASRLRDEEIDKDETEVFIGIIEDCLANPHKSQITGLLHLFKFADTLREDIREYIPEWLETAELNGISKIQALINIDTYQVTPIKRLVSFLYIMSIDESDIFDILNTVNKEESICRLLDMHEIPFINAADDKRAQERTKNRLQKIISKSL